MFLWMVNDFSITASKQRTSVKDYCVLKSRNRFQAQHIVHIITGFVYSFAEYWCPVWSRSIYIAIQDLSTVNFTEPHSMCWCSGICTLQAICHDTSTDKMLSDIQDHQNWPLYTDVPQRLASWRPDICDCCRKTLVIHNTSTVNFLSSLFH